MKQIRHSATKFLDKLPTRQILIGSTLILFAIGAVDYFVTVNLGMSIFYVLPIACLTWYLGQRSGYLSSMASALLWCIAEAERLTAAEADAFLLMWNTGVRLTFFLIIVVLLCDLKEAYRHEQRLAKTDSLTSLLNRRAFTEILEREIQRSQRHEFAFTLAYLDVDNFKQVNDELGHAAGDRLLQDIAAVLEQQVRVIDFPSRLGGDEFALLMPQTDFQQAAIVLNRVFDELLTLKSPQMDIGFSVGAVSFISPLPESGDQALKAADHLMYSVKTQGKNRLAQAVYHPLLLEK